MATDLTTKEGRMEAVKSQLSSQNALHSMFANVLDRMGGEDFLNEWAEDNPTRFLNLMVKMTPGLMPTASLTGDINIRIHNDLGPSSLDGGRDEREVAPEFLGISNE